MRICQRLELPLSDTETPCIGVVRGAKGDPIRVARQTEYMLFEFRRCHPLINGDTITHYMKVGRLKIDYTLAGLIRHPRIPDVPLFRYLPI